MANKFASVRRVYDDFHRDMLSKGRLMLKDTGIGYWGISPTTELFELFEKTKLSKHKRFVDLGSGDGRVAVVADMFTNATGIEFDNELHGFATKLAKQTKSGAKLINENYMNHPLGPYDYIFIHPDNHIKNALEEKLIREMKKNAKLVVFGPHFHPEELKKKETLDIQGTLVSVFQK